MILKDLKEEIDWRDFIGKPYWEMPMEELNEAVIKTEIKSIMDDIGLPFRKVVSILHSSVLKFIIQPNSIWANNTTNEFIVRGNILIDADGDIEIYIKKPYETEEELIVFKTELTPLLHHELTHYFQLQKSVFGFKKAVANIKEYISQKNDIMAYANQASKMINRKELDQIIRNTTYNPDETMPGMIKKHGTDPLFKNGKGIVWLYFTWFKKSHPVRKRFVKYFIEYRNHLQ